MEKDAKKSTKKGTNVKKDNKSLVVAIILICMLIVLAISLTYAYFSKKVVQNGDDPVTNVQTGVIDVDFTTSEYISNSSAKLINDNEAYLLADKTVFSVSRSALNTVEKVYYTLSLVDINISDNLKSQYLKWRLYETTDITDSTKPLSSGTFENLEGDVMDLYNTKIPLAKDVIDEFVLLVWLSNDESKNQIDLLEGKISAKVQVTAVNN